MVMYMIKYSLHTEFLWYLLKRINSEDDDINVPQFGQSILMFY